MSLPKNKNTSDLIAGLCDDLSPAKPCRPYQGMMIWLVFSVAYLALNVIFADIRHDMAGKLTEASFLFETGIGVAILLSAAFSSSWMNVPDMGQKRGLKAVPLSLFFILMLWICVKAIEQGSGFFDGLQMTYCVPQGLMMQGMPIVGLLIMTMRGYTTRPYWSMVMNVLAVSALGWLGLRLTCSMDGMGHSFFNHLLPFVIIGAALGLFARKLFKW